MCVCVWLYSVAWQPNFEKQIFRCKRVEQWIWMATEYEIVCVCVCDLTILNP